MEIIFYILIFFFFYPYFVYPVLLYLIHKFKKTTRKIDNQYEPKVTILLSVYNEESLIIECLNSIYKSDYKLENFDILIGSDGSNDNTNKLIEGYAEGKGNLQFFIYDRIGKNFVLNNLINHVKTDYVFYMDADIRLTKDSIKQSIKYLKDENVGIIISRMIQVKKENYSETMISENLQFDNVGFLGESFYQKYEHYLRLWSSEIDTSVNSLGAFYLMKMNLYEAIPNSKVCDDYYTVLTCLVQHKKVVYNSESVVFEVREKNLQNEFKRRVRLSSGILSTIYSKKSILGFSYGWASYFTWSNKFLRLLSPLFIILTVIIGYFFLDNVVLVNYFRVIFEGLLLLFVLAVIIDKFGTNFGRTFVFFKIYRFFILMNIGFLFGLIDFFKGNPTSKWEHDI